MSEIPPQPTQPPGSGGSPLGLVLLGGFLLYTGLSTLGGGAIFGLAGVGMTLAFSSELGDPRHDWALDESHVVVEGEVTEVRPTNAEIMGEDVFRVHYSYAYEGTREGVVSLGESHLLVDRGAGQRIGVEAHPEQPDLSRIVGTRACYSLVPIGIGVVFGAVGVLVGLGALLPTVLGLWALLRALRVWRGRD